MKFLWILLSVTLMVILSACAGGGEGNNIKIEDAWVRAVSLMPTQEQGGDMGQMAGGMSAAYMRILNSGNEPDRLLKVSSDVAMKVEMHMSEMKEGVMTMRPVDSIDVPANGQVELKPGGLHIMLIGINRDLTAGEKVKLTLDFEKAGEIQVEADIRAP